MSIQEKFEKLLEEQEQKRRTCELLEKVEKNVKEAEKLLEKRK